MMWHECCQLTKQHFLRESPDTCTISKGQLSRLLCWAAPHTRLSLFSYRISGASHLKHHYSAATMEVVSRNVRKRCHKLVFHCLRQVMQSVLFFLIYLIGIHIELYITSMCIFHDSIAMQLQSTTIHPKYFTSAHFFQVPIEKCLKLWC